MEALYDVYAFINSEWELIESGASKEHADSLCEVWLVGFETKVCEQNSR